MENQDLGREFGWDDEIEKDSSKFELLPEGDYDFTVTGFERARHAGSPKLPACNKAIVELTVESNEGISYKITHNLFLHSITEGMLSAFFIAIGQKKHGEKLKMNWTTVIGSKGKCKVYIDNYTNNKGEQRQSNKIKKFYEPEENAPAPVVGQGFVPGNF